MHKLIGGLGLLARWVGRTCGYVRGFNVEECYMQQGVPLLVLWAQS